MTLSTLYELFSYCNDVEPEEVMLLLAKTELRAKLDLLIQIMRLLDEAERKELTLPEFKELLETWALHIEEEYSHYLVKEPIYTLIKSYNKKLREEKEIKIKTTIKT